MNEFHGAVLPGGTGRGQDRWWAAGSAAVVLDGASAFAKSTADAGEYVDRLIAALAQGAPCSDRTLSTVLHNGIAQVGTELRLEPGSGPSSTALIARITEHYFEILALGDSTAIVHLNNGEERRITDSRLAEIGKDKREEYRVRLHRGSGYDDLHRKLLQQLQEEEHKARNVLGGYWIAEAEPAAAEHALIERFPVQDVAWCVLATDGAQRAIDHLQINWEHIARMSERELANLLTGLHHWEARVDPQGALLPRAKVHDDKTLVTWSAT